MGTEPGTICLAHDTFPSSRDQPPNENKTVCLRALRLRARKQKNMGELGKVRKYRLDLDESRQQFLLRHKHQIRVRQLTWSDNIENPPLRDFYGSANQEAENPLIWQLHRVQRRSEHI